MRYAAVAFAFMLSSASANAVDFRWATGFDMGAFSASVRNKVGSVLILSCGADKTSGNVQVISKALTSSQNANNTVQIVIDGRNYPIYIEHNLFEANSRSKYTYFYNLVKALVTTKSTSLRAEYPEYSQEERFSLLNVKDALMSIKDCRF